MRLAVISDEVSQDLATVVDTAVSLGFEGVEMRSFGGLAPTEHDADALRNARRLVQRAGLAIAGYCPPALKSAIPRDDEEIAAARAALLDAAMRGQLLGAPHARVFSFYRDGEPDPSSAAAVFREVVSGLPLALPLLLETGTRTHTPSVAYAEKFLAAADGRIDGLLWDPGNSVFAGFITDEVEDEWLRGHDLIRHVHVKDPRARQGYVRLGDGDVPWPALLRRMSRDGYSGWLSLETHWRMHAALSPALRDEPHGDAFSAGGYGASVECMQILRDWVGALP